MSPSRSHSAWLQTALWVLASAAALPAQATVRAWLESDHIAPADTVQLTIHREGQSGGRPDLTPLQKDFDVLTTQSRTSIQIVNGTTSAGTDIIATLSPKRDGRLTVPSIAWDGERSQPLTLLVDPQASGGGNNSPHAAAPNVLLETTVDDKQPYVQAEVRLTVRIYAGETLYRPALELSANNDVLVQQLGADERARTEKNGQLYDVLTRHYAIFPQRSGHLQLAAPVLQAEIANRPSRANPLGSDPFAGFFGNSPFGSMMTTTRPVRVHGQAIDLDVKARPPDTTTSYWIPAREVNLSTEWHPQPLQVRAGDPATLDLHVQATGLTAEQLPDLTKLLELPAGLKEYPDQAKLANAAQGTDVVGSRDQSIALIADQPGKFTIPALTLRWWDTQEKQMRTVSLPGSTIEVLPATVSAVAPQTSSTPAQLPVPAPTRDLSSSPNVTPRAESFWRPLALASLLLWLITIGVVLLRRRRSTRPRQVPPASAQSVTSAANQTRAAFLTACRDNDPHAARRSLIEWLAAANPNRHPLGLNALAREANEPSLTPLLRDLDRACYVGGQWSGQALAAALQELPVGLQTKPHPHRAEHLAPLYP